MTYDVKKWRWGLTAKQALSCMLTLCTGIGVEAATPNPSATGYLIDSSATVVRSGAGLCWQVGSDSTRSVMRQCNSEPLQTKAPVIVKPSQQAAAAAPEAVLARMTFDAETLFGFDKSDLRPAGRKVLDDFVKRIGNTGSEAISVVGYTDRIGTDAYNQALSERRAASVGDYLISRGIGADRIHTEGRGKADPITKEGECAGGASTSVIACLQPDRRVEIEVKGDGNGP